MLSKRFGPKFTAATAVNTVSDLKQKPRESCAQFLDRVVLAVNRQNSFFFRNVLACCSCNIWPLTCHMAVFVYIHLAFDLSYGRLRLYPFAATSSSKRAVRSARGSISASSATAKAEVPGFPILACSVSTASAASSIPCTVFGAGPMRAQNAVEDKSESGPEEDEEEPDSGNY